MVSPLFLTLTSMEAGAALKAWNAPRAPSIAIAAMSSIAPPMASVRTGRGAVVSTTPSMVSVLAKAPVLLSVSVIMA